MQHEELVEEVLRRLRGRRATIWDARRLIAPYRNRWIALELADGQFAGVECEAILRDIVHRPDEGFGLLLDRLRPVAARARTQGRRLRVPLVLVRRIPKFLQFLTTPPERWPWPTPFQSCEHCRAAFVAGRFCHQCGKCVRKKRGWPGAAFSEMQRLLRERPASRACSCGGMIAESWAFCTKCGDGVGST